MAFVVLLAIAYFFLLVEFFTFENPVSVWLLPLVFVYGVSYVYMSWGAMFVSAVLVSLTTFLATFAAIVAAVIFFPNCR